MLAGGVSDPCLSVSLSPGGGSVQAVPQVCRAQEPGMALWPSSA